MSSLDRVLDRPRFWLAVSLSAAQFWIRHNAFQHAGALAFYTLFSLAPIAIIAVALTGFFFGESAAQGGLVSYLEEYMGRESAEVLETAIAQSSQSYSGWWSTLLGLLMLMVGATTVFGQLQYSLNQIWDVTAKPNRSTIAELVKTRILSLTLVLTIGFLLLVSLLLSTAITAIVNYADQLIPFHPLVLRGMDLGLSLVVFTILFTMIFKILPDVLVETSDLLRGALVTAVLFILGKFGISYYLGQTTTASTYGAAGSLVVLLMWVYYSSLILLYGCAFTRASVEHLGKGVCPSKTAVRIRQEIVEEV